MGYAYFSIIYCKTCGVELSVQSTKDKKGWNNEQPVSVKDRASEKWNRRA